jgi:hypothetical protein
MKSVRLSEKLAPFHHTTLLSLSLYGSTAIVDLGRFFSFLILYTSDVQLAAHGPQLDLHRPPPSHRFGSIGESFNICLILLVQRKI